MVNAPYIISGIVRKDEFYDYVIIGGEINALGAETQDVGLGMAHEVAPSQLVTIKHTSSSEELTATTDANGLYIIDLANLTTAYAIGDAYTITVENIPASSETVEDYHYGAKARKFVLTDPSGNAYQREFPVPVRVLSPIKDIGTHLIEQSKAYIASVSFDAVADAGIGQVLIQTGQYRECHLEFSTLCDGNADVFFFENVVVSANGTGVTSVNKNRLNPDTAITAITHTPTVTSTGTTLATGRIAGGNGKFASGGVSGHDSKWILKKNTKYILRVTNNAGSAKDVNITLNFHEM